MKKYLNLQGVKGYHNCDEVNQQGGQGGILLNQNSDEEKAKVSQVRTAENRVMANSPKQEVF